MSAKIVENKNSKVKIEIEIELDKSFLRTEENIQSSLNEGGVLATEIALGQHDADGSPIILEGERLTSKGRLVFF